MNKNMEPIYMDQNGYNKLLEEVNNIREKINTVEVYSNSNSTDRYDLEAEDIRRKKEVLAIELNILISQLERCVIIEKEKDSSVIDLDDIIVVDMFVNTSETVENTFKLVGGMGNLFAEIPEISVNSPLGKSIYKKHIGEICTYNVEKRDISVLIKSKLNLDEELKNPQR